MKLIASLTIVGLASVFNCCSAFADGFVRPPRAYEGSLEEKAQEAIIIFHGSEEPGEAREDLILKIQVQGSGREELDNFAWIIPLPGEPEYGQEDAALFQELHNYVEARLSYSRPKSPGVGAAEGVKGERPTPNVEVLSRRVVGSFDVAVVRDKASDLNSWLEHEGFQTIDDAEDVLDFYRQKEYVFTCVKVDEAQLESGYPIDLHPLRFSFKTRGQDGAFFPMKLTGLQSQPFDVNLYVFYRFWLNDSLNKFGYEYRGFERKYRDWDSPQCEPNGGKDYSRPQGDAFLTAHAHRLPTVTKLLQRLHPGERYYLTNIQAHGLKPAEVRTWADDLWMFPYYTNRDFVPHDARASGAASAAWPNEPGVANASSPAAEVAFADKFPWWLWALLAGGLATAIACFIAGLLLARRRGLAIAAAQVGSHPSPAPQEEISR